MNGATVIAVIAVVAILFFAARYIYKEKKKGNACIGCPYSASCPKHQQGISCDMPQDNK
ncbi:MAG: FeoB-associated Cys-rich membrane protein [Mogibacterium sp.]|nr:FeoB-associated Cys-rich membrane protein [Mogibacterium sp.]